jgi:hypothetical protein
MANVFHTCYVIYYYNNDVVIFFFIIYLIFFYLAEMQGIIETYRTVVDKIKLVNPVDSSC